MSRKFIGYFRLLDACGAPGCPVCRCAAEVGRSYLAALLYERVNDPESRRLLRASRGFCSWHTSTLHDIRDSAFGASILCEDLLGRAIQELEAFAGEDARAGRRLTGWLARVAGKRSRPSAVERDRKRSPCRVCVEVAGAEWRYIETMLGFAGDAQLRRAYEGSQGLCVPHVLRVLEQGGGGAAAREVLRLTLPKWTAVRQSLALFVSKHDYRSTVPYTEEEATACARGFEILSGAPGLSGNDLGMARKSSRPGSASASGPEGFGPRR